MYRITYDVINRQYQSIYHAIPTARVVCFIDNASLRIAISLRLGADDCVPHICKCGVTTDSKGHHGLVYDKSSG